MPTIACALKQHSFVRRDQGVELTEENKKWLGAVVNQKATWVCRKCYNKALHAKRHHEKTLVQRAIISNYFTSTNTHTTTTPCSTTLFSAINSHE
jgi:hypothetical protein